MYADFANLVELTRKTVVHRYMYIIHPVEENESGEDDIVDQIKEIIDEKSLELRT